MTLLADLTTLAQVLLIDLTLAGDNAVVVGLAVAGLPRAQQRRAVFAGIAGATLMRMALGAVALRLLAVIGLVLAGGLLLLWVCWRMYRELRRPAVHGAAGHGKTLRQAIIQIVLADVSMSLDNVLAVAGAAQGNLIILLTGLAISVLLMGIAAAAVARLLERHRWLAWFGLAIVLYVAVHMIWEGWRQIAAAA
jgi:YjbE family integral membrane protein